MGGLVSKPSAPAPAPAPVAPEPVVDTIQDQTKRRAQAGSRALTTTTGIQGPADFATKTLLGQ